MPVLKQLLQAWQRITSMPEMPSARDNESLAEADYLAAPAKLKVLELPKVLEQRILDIGCGLGGKTLYYSEQGAQLVVGVDMSEERARVAQTLAGRHMAGAKVRIVVGDAARLPFRADVFDCAISIDAWEHLHSPDLTLCECARVIQPRNIIFISALPYFSPWGAHAWYWLPLPWIQIIVPHRILFRLMSWIETRRQVNERLPSAVRLDWTRPENPAHAQGLTVTAFERSLTASRMEILRFAVVPVGMRYGGMAVGFIGALMRLPFLREPLAGMVIAVMRKPLPEEQ